MCSGNNNQFGLAGILCAGNGKNEQNLGPMVDSEAREIGYEQIIDCEPLDMEMILYSLYPHRTN